MQDDMAGSGDGGSRDQRMEAGPAVMGGPFASVSREGPALRRMNRIPVHKAIPALAIAFLLLLSSCLSLSLPAYALASESDSSPKLTASSHEIGSDSSEALTTCIPDYRGAMRFFVENQGQFDGSVRFIAVTEFGKAVFYDSQVQYLLERYQDGNLSGTDIITLTYPGSDAVEPRGIGLLPHRTNYFVGDPSAWAAGVSNYASITYQDLWPGIDLSYRFSEEGLKYEFHVDPFVQESQVRIAVEGATVLCQSSSLSLDTGNGRLVDGGLIAYHQESKEELPARFLVDGDAITFRIEGRDPSQGLVIDPLVYSTYIGGSGYDFCHGIVADASGNAYLTGWTESTDLPVVNPVQSAKGGGSDIFILKFDAAGSALMYSTYLGGSGEDSAMDIAIDADGCAYVTGYTNSTDLPTSSPVQGTYGGGDYDAFVLKLSSTGNALIYSTYIGGGDYDDGRGIEVDATGAACVAGYTWSTDFPTASPLQGANRGDYDAFVLKLNPSGSALLYSTYIGGGDWDFALDVSLDDDGDAHITGGTYSTNFPTKSAYQVALAGVCDIFALELSSDGTAIVHSTYVGGGGYDCGQAIAVDGAGNEYLSGYSESTDFPVSLGSFQGTHAGGEDAVAFKLNAPGNSLAYSTFIGGAGYDVVLNMAVDGLGTAYLIGHTNSTDFPTSRPFQSTNSGDYDAFVARLGATGTSLLFSSYLGGGDYDSGYDIFVDTSGRAYLTGGTYSLDFPCLDPLQGNYAGGCDGFMLKLDLNGSALKFSSFVGGNAEDQCQGMNLDPDGNVYVSGLTYSNDFPVQGPFQAVNGGNGDAFVLKFGPAGGLIYSTYVGGNDYDNAFDLVVDAAGNAYVTGLTYSTDFPTASPRQPNLGGETDAFVLKLGPAGSALVYSTYLGGSDYDYGYDIALDTAGNAYVSGLSYSTDFPTAGPLFPSLAGDCDAFVAKMNVAGSALIYSTYLGGAGDDRGMDIAVDQSGNAYVTGWTNSTDFPTASPLQGTNGGGYDAFVLKLNAAGSALLYSTYIGGEGTDQGQGIALDAVGEAHVTGTTNSTSFPTSSPFQAIRGGDHDAFVLKLNAAGSALLYSTYMGGSDYDFAFGIDVDGSGNAYVAGFTYSTNFPTSSPLQPENRGNDDAFVLKLDRTGRILVLSTYIGGSSYDFALAVAANEDGSAYVTGTTNSADFPVSSAYQGAIEGDFDVFVLKLGEPDAPSAPLDLSATPGNGKVDLAWSAPASDGGSPIDYFVVYRNGTEVAQATGTSTSVTGLTNGITYSFAVAAHNSVGTGEPCDAIDAKPVGEPGAPTNLQAFPGNTEVTLTWSAPVNDGGAPIDYYVVYQNDADVAHPTAASLTVTGLVNGVNYSFAVAAHNSVGEGPQTPTINATPSAQAIVPGSPTNLVVTPGDSKVTLSWQAPTGGGTGIDRYLIYQNGTLLKNTTSLSTEVTGLRNGVTYSFAVAAHNQYGLGPQTDAQQATPSPGGGGGLDLTLILGIVGAAAAAAALGAFFLMRSRKGARAPSGKLATASSTIQSSVPSPPPPEDLPRYCPWCGAEESGSGFCGHCGRKMS